MKTRLILTLSILLLFFASSIKTREWSDYVPQALTPENQKQQFIDLVDNWQKEQIQNTIITDYTNRGVAKEEITAAINERIKRGKSLIASQFKENNINISPSLDRIENKQYIKKNIAAIGHERLQKLNKEFNIPINDSVYSCLCSSAGTVGAGLSYSPQADEHCENSDPCKGGNWGCASSDFPKSTAIWSYCSSKNKESNLFDNNIDVLVEKQIAQGTRMLPRLTQNELAILNKNIKYKDLCLQNMSEDIENAVWQGNRNTILANARTIAENSENICEEAVQVSLYLNSEKGLTKFETTIELIKPWVNILDPVTQTENFLKVAPYLSSISNLSSNYDVLKDVYKDYNSNQQFKEASKLFSDSKKWTTEKMIDFNQNINKNIEDNNSKVKAVDLYLKMHINQIRPDVLHGSFYSKESKFQAKDIGIKWDIFNNRRKILIEKAKTKVNTLLQQKIGLIMQQEIIKSFRIPLSQMSCEDFLKQRKRECSVY